MRVSISFVEPEVKIIDTMVKIDQVFVVLTMKIWLMVGIGLKKLWDQLAELNMFLRGFLMLAGLQHKMLFSPSKNYTMEKGEYVLVDYERQNEYYIITILLDNVEYFAYLPAAIRIIISTTSPFTCTFLIWVYFNKQIMSNKPNIFTEAETIAMKLEEHSTIYGEKKTFGWHI